MEEVVGKDSVLNNEPVDIQPGCGPKEFRVGDVVTLAGGGARMTVDDLGRGPRPDGAIDCVWFDPEGQLHRDAFLPDTLKPAYKDLIRPGGTLAWRELVVAEFGEDALAPYTQEYIDRGMPGHPTAEEIIK